MCVFLSVEEGREVFFKLRLFTVTIIAGIVAMGISVDKEAFVSLILNDLHQRFDQDDSYKTLTLKGDKTFGNHLTGQTGNALTEVGRNAPVVMGHQIFEGTLGAGGVEAPEVLMAFFTLVLFSRYGWSIFYVPYFLSNVVILVN